MKRYQYLFTFFTCLTLFSANTQASSFDLSQHKGNVVYLEFWASWCVPCRAAFPWMGMLQDKYEAAGLKIIAVNTDTSLAMADKFLASYPAKFDVIYDTEGDLSYEYRLKAMPSSFLYGRDGELITQHIGFNDKIAIEMEVAIEKALDTINP